MLDFWLWRPHGGRVQAFDVGRAAVQRAGKVSIGLSSAKAARRTTGPAYAAQAVACSIARARQRRVRGGLIWSVWDGASAMDGIAADVFNCILEIINKRIHYLVLVNEGYLSNILMYTDVFRIQFDLNDGQRAQCRALR
jgi:hypothetical protein